jgi:hypothetical protein
MAALLFLISSCASSDPSSDRAQPATAPVTIAARQLSNAQLQPAAARLRAITAPQGFQHADADCPAIGDIADPAMRLAVCFGTRATTTKPTVAQLQAQLAPLGVDVAPSFTECGAMGSDFRHAVCRRQVKTDQRAATEF